MPGNNDSFPNNKYNYNKNSWIPWVALGLSFVAIIISIWRITLSHAPFDIDNEVLRFSYDKLGTIIGIILSAVALVISLFFIIIGIRADSIRRGINDDAKNAQNAIEGIRNGAAEEAKKAIEGIRNGAAEEAKKAIEGIQNVATEDTKKIVDAIREDAAEEAKKAIEGIRNEAAEETKKIVDTVRQDAAEEAKKAIEGIRNGAAEETRKIVDAVRQDAADEAKKAIEGIRNEAVEETRRIVETIRKDAECIRKDIENESKDNKVLFVTMIFEMYSEVVSMIQGYYNSTNIGKDKKDEVFTLEQDKPREPIVKLKLDQYRFACDPKNLDIEDDGRVKEIIMKGINLIPDLNSNENDLKMLEEVMNKSNDRDIKRAAQFAIKQLKEKLHPDS